jgi:hypothetical protein
MPSTKFVPRPQRRKLHKGSVAYGPGMQGAECMLCERFQPPECLSVQGSIDPHGWCRLFRKKSDETPAERIEQ